MKRIAALVAGLVVVLIVLALTTFPANQNADFPGYMEADLVLVGSEQGGRVAKLSVEEGAHVKQGDPIFELESSEQEASVAAAKSRVAEADARLADVQAELQRPGEIEVLEASLNEAKAMLQVASNNLDRARTLFAKGWITKAQLDDTVAQHDRNEASVAEADKRITAARLPGRSDMIDAAKANAEAARHALVEAEKNLGKRQVAAPAGGTVEEVYFRPGEVVNAGQAVVALLPPRNLKVSR
jgi:HlyD family secretion protein